MSLDQLYLIFQPIVKVEKRNSIIVEEYEVLLRSTEKDQFPTQLFCEILSNEVKYQNFFQWFQIEILKVLEENPKTIFSLNFDIDQFQFSATTFFFDRVSSFSDRLIIEITEHRPRNKPELMDSLTDILRTLKAYHFTIAIDDFTEGINTCLLYIKYKDYYDRIKISLTGTFSLLYILLLVCYTKWLKLVSEREIAIVVERVDSRKKSKMLQKIGISLQQGFYWGKGNKSPKVLRLNQ
ncbi:EAL domain-containing protein [Streptococcus uberis]|uniref:EAL domain-containing protein n=1 Tax=Streptococcus uberis TaxID=1349 RepID=UPI00062026E1|nr:EAL domain-containing protein [Streptococcus uberis]KKF43414.1 hypothetical protein AF64_02250 [Streptococcus uberis C9359]KKF44718.1 hypothetical protein AF63_02245 [Streptococcus uberis Ab71]KKF46610.1 hypothetical protein AF62_01645 [Streptococcus uberis C8329]KKF48500.1 hypothetical protein AF59_05160 [Streptococcus uberis C5072]KKF51091.1 hypothetical protein AF60_05230 [Streptococcus uberis S6261]